MSTAHLVRTPTYPGDAARLVEAYTDHQHLLPQGERRRLGWIKLFSDIVEYAKAHDWPELLDHEKDIEEIVRGYTKVLGGETKVEKRNEPKKTKGPPTKERKTYNIPPWDKPYHLRRLAPLLYRSHKFYRYILHDLKRHYGEDLVTLEGSRSAPDWLEDDSSICNQMNAATWQCSIVTWEERFDALVSLRGPKADKANVEVKLRAVDKAAKEIDVDLNHMTDSFTNMAAHWEETVCFKLSFIFPGQVPATDELDPAALSLVAIPFTPSSDGLSSKLNLLRSSTSLKRAIKWLSEGVESELELGEEGEDREGGLDWSTITYFSHKYMISD